MCAQATTYLGDRYPVCPACGAVTWGNATCPNCVLHWDFLPREKRRDLSDRLKSGYPGRPIGGSTTEAETQLRMLQYRAFEALERFVGLDWEQKLRLARAEDEWRQEWEMRDYYAEAARKERWQGLRATLRDRAKCEDDRDLNRLQRWAYSAKAVICILLDIRFKPQPAHAITFHFRDADDGGQEKTVTVYAEGFDAKTARRIAVHRQAIHWNWPPMTREKAIKEARSRFWIEDGWNIDFIDTGMISNTSNGLSSSWSATWVSVPAGWRRWGYRIESDGDSSY